MVQTVVKAHGGAIKVDTKEGEARPDAEVNLPFNYQDHPVSHKSK